MIRWIVILVFMLFISSAVFAQGSFSCFWNYADQPGLTTTCGGSNYLPDGTVVKIFWDSNNNGPDFSDPQPTLCNNPPLCDDGSGPQGSSNLTQFTLNGDAEIGQPGCFVMLTGLISVDILPTPAGFYLVIFDTNGTTRLWTSSVHTMISGYQEVYLLESDWTCGSGLPRCVVRDEHE